MVDDAKYERLKDAIPHLKTIRTKIWTMEQDIGSWISAHRAHFHADIEKGSEFFRTIRIDQKNIP